VSEDVRDLIARVCEKIDVDQDTLSAGKRRQAAMFAGREADYIPICFGAPAEGLGDLPTFDWRQQFYDPAKSLYMQLRGAVGAARARSDRAFGVRADLGVTTVPSIFGVGIAVPEHTKPWCTANVSKDVLVSFEVPDDISDLGVMPRLREHMQHHAQVLAEHGLGDVITVHHCDTQGAFDIACQARGHDFFLDLYDDPAFAHRLMEQSVKAYVAVSRLCKNLNGEPLHAGNASGIWSESGGVRACDDSGILLREDVFREFVLPYHCKSLRPFGGGWMHYCGGVKNGNRWEGVHLHDAYLSADEIKGLNFTTGGDMCFEVAKISRTGKFAYVGFDRDRDESLEDYFLRVVSCLESRRGLIFMAALRGDEWCRAKDVWHSVQDQRLPAAAVDKEAVELSSGE